MSLCLCEIWCSFCRWMSSAASALALQQPVKQCKASPLAPVDVICSSALALQQSVKQCQPLLLARTPCREHLASKPCRVYISSALSSLHPRRHWRLTTSQSIPSKSLSIMSKLQVFDLAANKRDPVSRQKIQAKSGLTRLSFNTHHPVVLIGDDR